MDGREKIIKFSLSLSFGEFWFFNLWNLARTGSGVRTYVETDGPPQTHLSINDLESRPWIMRRVGKKEKLACTTSLHKPPLQHSTMKEEDMMLVVETDVVWYSKSFKYSEW